MDGGPPTTAAGSPAARGLNARPASARRRPRSGRRGAEALEREVAGAEGRAVDDFVRLLENHRLGCERQGKYIEADLAAQRIQELRLNESDRRMEALKSRQISERLALEQAHGNELGEFNALWDERLRNYEAKGRALEVAMRARHAQELEALRKARALAGRKPKFSKELLNLRTVQMTLAKQKDYRQAHHIKEKADALEVQEMEINAIDARAKKNGSEEKALTQHGLELNALAQRVRRGVEEHKRRRRQDLERLLLRYNKSLKTLEKQQRVEQDLMKDYLWGMRARREKEQAEARGKRGPAPARPTWAG